MNIKSTTLQLKSAFQTPLSCTRSFGGPERPKSIKTWPRRWGKWGGGFRGLRQLRGLRGLRGQTTLLDCRAPLEMMLHLRRCPEIGFEPLTQSGKPWQEARKGFSLFGSPLYLSVSSLFASPYVEEAISIPVPFADPKSLQVLASS